MSFRDLVVVVSGGSSGIGAALVDAFINEGAIVAIADLHTNPKIEYGHKETSTHRRLYSFCVDVTNSIQVRNMISSLMNMYGRIDVYCSNAGILYQPPSTKDGGSVTQHTDDQWNRIFQVNALSHVIALRELLPYWNRINTNHDDGSHKRPIFLINASAAGLLTQIGNASYGVSKAAAVSVAEHIAIEHENIQVYCLCPQAVDTPMVRTAITNSENQQEQLTSKERNLRQTTPRQKALLNSAMTDGVMKPWQVAQCTLQALSSSSTSSSTIPTSIFIFPHSKVPLYFERKACDHARWINGMQKLKRRLDSSSTTSSSPPQSKL